MPATPLFLLIEIQNRLPFGCWLTRFVPEDVVKEMAVYPVN